MVKSHEIRTTREILRPVSTRHECFTSDAWSNTNSKPSRNSYDSLNS